MDAVLDSSALRALTRTDVEVRRIDFAVKGCVRLRKERSPVIVQFVFGDRFAQIAEATSVMAGVKSGLTSIVKRK